MSAALPESDASLKQQTPDLVDDCGASNDPALSHPVQRLHVELVIRLDRDKAHGWPRDCFADRLGIDEVALVRLHVRLHVLSRDDPHLMTLYPECSSQEMSSGTCLHADQVGLSVRRKLQQLSAGTLPAHNDFAPQVQANQVKDRLAEINADRVYLHGNLLRAPLISQTDQGGSGGPSH